MRLKLDELRRGFIRWFSNTPVGLSLITADEGEVEQRQSAPLTDPHGSVSDVRLGRFIQPVLQIGWTGVPLKGISILVEQMRGPAIRTLVIGTNQRLRHIPSHGYFHRLVMDARHANWSEDAAVYVGETRIRFITGEIEIEEVTAFDRVTVNDNKYSLEGGQEATVVKSGRFVEIVAPGISADDAVLNAYATRGLLAALMGHHMAGGIASSEAYVTQPSGQVGRVEIPVRAALPRTIADDELALLDDVLSRLAGDDRKTRTLLLGLRWFERGFSADVPIDRFLSFYFAVESIVNVHAGEKGPLPVQVQRKERYTEALEQLKGSIDNDAYSRVANALQQTTMNERFAFYIVSNGLKPELTDKWRSLSKLRNDLVHGDKVTVTAEDAGALQDLLVVILKTEMQVEQDLPWESFPHIHSFGVEFEWPFEGTAQSPGPAGMSGPSGSNPPEST